MHKVQQTSYKSIIKSTSFVGGAKIFSVFFNIIRTKAIAVMLGPSGMGLIGALTSSLSLVQSFSGLGIGFSAVRSVAKADGAGDRKEISETIVTLRRIVIFTGMSGMLATIFLSSYLSHFTFGSNEYALEIKMLSVIVFLQLVQGGQGALIQGMRRIKDLSKMTIWGAAFSTIFSVPLVYMFREDGIVPFLIMVAAAQLFTSWYYARKIKVQKVQLSIIQILSRSKGMIKLGFAFMGGSLTAAASVYLIRVIIIRFLGLEAAGFYQAAMAISTLYIGVVLDAMAKDFYPRLTAVAEDSETATRIINEQIEIGLLIAAPGLLITLGLAPFIINLLYAADFEIAYEILRWMILGIFLRLISWPMAFLFVAKGKGKIYLMTQIVSHGLHVGLILWLVPVLGLIGSGVSFFALYVIYVVLIKVLVYKENGFVWSLSNKRDFILLFLVFAASFVILWLTSELTGSAIVCGLSLLVFYYVIRRMMSLFGITTYSEIWAVIKRKSVYSGQKPVADS